MSKVIAGRKPLSSKSKSSPLSEPDFFMNKTALSAELIKEIADQGMDYRWIDYKRYANEGNMHSRGWSIYKRKTSGGTDAFLLGSNPDGIVRRGTMVLAVRPLAHTERHRAYIAEKTARYKNFNESKADELRQKARELGSAVDADYDGDDSE